MSTHIEPCDDRPWVDSQHHSAALNLLRENEHAHFVLTVLDDEIGVTTVARGNAPAVLMASAASLECAAEMIEDQHGPGLYSALIGLHVVSVSQLVEVLS